MSVNLLHPVTELPNVNVFYQQFEEKVATSAGGWGIIILDVRATEIMNETLSYEYQSSRFQVPTPKIFPFNC